MLQTSDRQETSEQLFSNNNWHDIIKNIILNFITKLISKNK